MLWVSEPSGRAVRSSTCYPTPRSDRGNSTPSRQAGSQAPCHQLLLRVSLWILAGHSPVRGHGHPRPLYWPLLGGPVNPSTLDLTQAHSSIHFVRHQLAASPAPCPAVFGRQQWQIKGL